MEYEDGFIQASEALYCSERVRNQGELEVIFRAISKMSAEGETQLWLTSPESLTDQDKLFHNFTGELRKFTVKTLIDYGYNVEFYQKTRPFRICISWKNADDEQSKDDNAQMLAASDMFEYSKRHDKEVIKVFNAINKTAVTGATYLMLWAFTNKSENERLINDQNKIFYGFEGKLKDETISFLRKNGYIVHVSNSEHQCIMTISWDPQEALENSNGNLWNFGGSKWGWNEGD